MTTEIREYLELNTRKKERRSYRNPQFAGFVEGGYTVDGYGLGGVEVIRLKKMI